MNNVYVLIAVDGDPRVRECVVVTSFPLASDLEKALINTWGASHVCMASRLVDLFESWLERRAAAQTKAESGER